jgi:hypothetical protein
MEYWDAGILGKKKTEKYDRKEMVFLRVLV